MCCGRREGRKNASPKAAPLAAKCDLTGRLDGPQMRRASREGCAWSKNCDRTRSGRHAKLKSDGLLETFVETPRHKGTCYKAANWQLVGKTVGRGKKSTAHEQLLPTKDILLYPLRPDFATVLRA